MNIENALRFFLWCSVINYAMLILWAVSATLGRNLTYGLVSRVYSVSREQFDLINYAGIAFYKMAIFLFNIVPLISLYIIK